MAAHKVFLAAVVAVPVAVVVVVVAVAVFGVAAVDAAAPQTPQGAVGSPRRALFLHFLRFSRKNVVLMVKTKIKRKLRFGIRGIFFLRFVGRFCSLSFDDRQKEWL